MEYTEYTNAPPLGRESGTLIPTIIREGEGGDYIDRCITRKKLMGVASRGQPKRADHRRFVVAY